MKQLLTLIHTSFCKFPIVVCELGKIEKELGNIDEAQKLFKSLLKTKSEPYAMFELALLEINRNNLEVARKYLVYLLNTQNKIFAISLLTLIEYLEKNYISALKYVNEALKQNIDVNSDLIISLSKELNVFFNFDYENIKYSYTVNQIIDYDEYCAVEHIIERHVQNNIDVTVFNESVDVYKLFNVVKGYLSEENKINKLNFNDLYLLRMDNIGSDGENYLLVVTLPHSKDILTMYPVKDKKGINKYIEEYENNGEKTLIKK